MAEATDQLEVIFEEEAAKAEDVKEPEAVDEGSEDRADQTADLSAQLTEALQTNAALAARVSELTELLGATRSEAGVARAIKEALGQKTEQLSEKEVAVKSVLTKLFPQLEGEDMTKKSVATVATVLKEHMDSVRAERSAQAADLTEDLMAAAGMDASNPATVQFVEQGVVAQIAADPQLKQLYQSGRIQKAVRMGFKKFSDTLPSLTGAKSGAGRVAEKVAAVQRPNAGPRSTGSGGKASAGPSIEPRTVKIDLTKVGTHQGRQAVHDAGFQLLQSLLGDDKE